MDRAAFTAFFLSLGYGEFLCELSLPVAEALDALPEETRETALRSPRELSGVINAEKSRLGAPLEIALAAGEVWAKFARLEKRRAGELSPIRDEPDEPELPNEPEFPAEAPEEEREAPSADPDIPYPTDESVAAFLIKLRADPGWAATDEKRRLLFEEEYPRNNDSDVVLKKLDFVSAAYPTRIYNKLALALSTANRASEIDGWIANGVDLAVEALAGHGPLKGYEPASRYCWCHRPDLHPLMTRNALRAMKYYRDTYRKGHFVEADVQSYLTYLNTLDHVIGAYGIRAFGRISASVFLDAVGELLKEKGKNKS